MVRGETGVSLQPWSQNHLECFFFLSPLPLPFLPPFRSVSIFRYGMAHVYYAQEKYKFAETYASRALSINSCSSIACTQVALVSQMTVS